MYQVLTGCRYEGPNDLGHFFNQRSNAIKRAVSISKEDYNLNQEQIENHYNDGCTYTTEFCWFEITDKDILSKWGAIRLWRRRSADRDIISDDEGNISLSTKRVFGSDGDWLQISKITTED